MTPLAQKELKRVLAHLAVAAVATTATLLFVGWGVSMAAAVMCTSYAACSLTTALDVIFFKSS